MGKHSSPEPQDYPDTLQFMQTTDKVLGLAPRYRDGNLAPGNRHNYDFEDWWEQYVTAPIKAANPAPEPKTVPLTANMPPTTGTWEPPSWAVTEDVYGSDNEVNMWRVFAYIIMGGMCAVILFYALAAALAVAFLALVVGVAWMGVAKK